MLGNLSCGFARVPPISGLEIWFISTGHGVNIGNASHAMVAPRSYTTNVKAKACAWLVESVVSPTILLVTPGTDSEE
jgi:hypothetical protein